MNIQIRFAGSMRNLAGTTELSVELPEDSSIRYLLNHLCELLPDEFVTGIINPALVRENTISTLMTINRRSVSNQELLEYKLKNRDSIAFVPPMEGG